MGVPVIVEPALLCRIPVGFAEIDLLGVIG
jgi:hypothetical protein